MSTTIDDILEDARKCQNRIAELRDQLADEEKRLAGFRAEAVRVIEAELASTPRKLPRNTHKAARPERDEAPGSPGTFADQYNSTHDGTR